MSASRRLPRSFFQPGIAAKYSCTGASPSAFAICGLPPERSFTGLAFVPELAGFLAFEPALAVFTALRAPPARDTRLAFGFALLERFAFGFAMLSVCPRRQGEV